MRVSEPRIVEAMGELGVELRRGVSLRELTSLGIGGTTDLLRVREHKNLPQVIGLLNSEGIAFRFLGGGSNLLVADGELPWVMLQLVAGEPEIRLEGNSARVDAAADLGRMVTFCAKHNLGGVGGALRMNAGAYGMQIGSFVREVEVYRAPTGEIETLRGEAIRFDYRHTSFAADDIMLAVKLELPSRAYPEIIKGIRICNEKRRASQPLGQKSAGCIFKTPAGASAGRMIDELGLKGFCAGDAWVSERHANFFINRGTASCADMLALIGAVRERVRGAYGVELEEEVVVWK